MRLFADPPEPLVPRWLCLPVDERVFADGNVLKSVERADVERAVEVMKAEGVTSVAVAFLYAYVNPVNEQVAAELLRELAPDIAVVYSFCAANSNRPKTRYDQPCNHLIGGTDNAIRPGSLSRHWCLVRLTGLASLPALAPYPDGASDTEPDAA